MGSQRAKLLVMRIGLVVATVALILGGVRKYRSQTSSGEDDPPAHSTGLYVNPERLTIGEVWEDDHFAWVLPIENRSRWSIPIKRFYNSCVCTEIDPPALVIPAGQSRDVRLTIDLMTEHGEDRRDAAVRDFAVTVGAVVRQPDGREVNQDWEIRGRVKRTIQFEPAAIDFGMHSERAQPLPSRRIQVRCLTPLDSLAVSGSLHHFPDALRTARKTIRISIWRSCRRQVCRCGDTSSTSASFRSKQASGGWRPRSCLLQRG
jgi:hypothetical protein